MSVFLYKFFHNKTNDRIEEGKTPVPDDMNKWPDSWKIVSYKTYHLFKAISLPVIDGDVWKVANRRRVSRVLMNNPINLVALSYILRCGYGLQTENGIDNNQSEHRTVPSGGRRYPLEIYIILFKSVEGCEAGIYHYGVKSHVMEPVILEVIPQTTIDLISMQEVIKGVRGIICMSAAFDRTIEKYGSRGYRYILLEAGHVAQNMSLAATEIGVTLIPIGGSSEKVIEHIIGLNDSQEGVVYTLFF
jgi:SagB-type dehydrogenase family enzyme